jgi:hypothetical protein
MVQRTGGGGQLLHTDGRVGTRDDAEDMWGQRADDVGFRTDALGAHRYNIGDVLMKHAPITIETCKISLLQHRRYTSETCPYYY